MRAKYWILLVILVATPLLSLAQVPFGPEQLFDTPPDILGPRIVRAVDLNDDGALDLVVASNWGIIWYRNAGAGVFDAKRPVSSETVNVLDVAFDDIDEDGDVDVIISDHAGERIVAYKNEDGAGAFGDAITIASDVPWTYGIHLADLDGDSDKDLLSVSTEVDEVTWHKRTDNSGTYGEKIALSFVENPTVVIASDIDNDGDQDVIVNAVNNTMWFENTDGAGLFSNAVSISEEPRSVDHFKAVDIDNDGDTDIAFGTRHWIGGIGWFRNEDGQGTWSEPLDIQSNTLFEEAFDLADVDADGALDVLTVLGGFGPLDVIYLLTEIDQQGQFGRGDVIERTESNITDIIAADLDGDGDPDIAAVTGDDNSVFWMENGDGLGGFGDPQIINELAGFPGSCCFIPLDVDRDGDRDVIAANGERIVWYEHHIESKTFLEKRQIGEGAYSPILTVDLDNDGDEDFVSFERRSLSSGFLRWHEQIDDTGAFETHFITTVTLLSSVLAKDINGDGLNDLLALTSESNVSAVGKITVLINGLPDRTFSGPQYIAPEDASASDKIIFEIGDLDADGDQDIATAHVFSGVIGWYENLGGSAGFGPRSLLAQADTLFPEKLAIVDFDGDNDDDIIAAVDRNTRFIWFEQTEPGVFSTEIELFSSPIKQFFLPPQDLDRDGDIDLLFTSSTGPRVFWYPNSDGQGTLGEMQVILTQPLPFIRFVDLDGDDDLDITFKNGDRMGWFENLLVTSTGSDGDPGSVESVIDLRALFPNPARESAQVELFIKETNLVEIELFDVLGRSVGVVFEGTLFGNRSYVFDVPLQHLPNGLFFVRTEDGAGSVSARKLMVLK